MATAAPPRIFRRQGSASAIHIWIRNTTTISRRRLDDACSSVSSLSTAVVEAASSSFYSAGTQNTITDDENDDSDCSCGSDFRFDTNLEVDDDDDDDSENDDDDDDDCDSDGSASMDLEHILPVGLRDRIHQGKDQEQPVDNNASTTNNRHDSAADLRWESSPNLECCLMLLTDQPKAASPLAAAEEDAPPHLPPRQASSSGKMNHSKHPSMSNNSSNHSSNYSNHKLRLTMAGTATKQAQRRITKILRSGLQRPRMPRRQLSNASSKLLGSVASSKQKKNQQQQRKAAESSPQDMHPEDDAGVARTTLLSKESTATDETSPESAHTEECPPEEVLMSGVGKTPRATLSERLRRFPLVDVPAMKNLSKKSSTRSKSSASSRGETKTNTSLTASGKPKTTKSVSSPSTASATATKSPCRRKLPTRAGQPRIQRLVRRSQLLDAAAAAAAASPRRRSTAPTKAMGRNLPRNSAWSRRRSEGVTSNPNPPPRLSSSGQRRGVSLEASLAGLSEAAM